MILQLVKQIKSGVVFTIKAPVRLVLANCLTRPLICTLRLLNPIGTEVTENDLKIP